MILGDRCTRGCRFCAVQTAKPLPPADDEPDRLAEAVAKLSLDHVVITAVSRDDLRDHGVEHFARCIRAVRRRRPEATVEVLPADFAARPELIQRLCQARPDVYNHNVETVERLSAAIRPQASYRRSLEVLRLAKRFDPTIVTKSGLMVGLGETLAELRQTFADLREVGCRILTVGQYLQPSTDHAEVVRYYRPEEFDELADEARSMGFAAVVAGPFVRSSYNAAEVYRDARQSRTGHEPHA